MRIASFLRITLLVSTVVLFFGVVRAQPGKNGSRTITASGTVVNEYTSVTADIAAGDLTISVVSSALNSGSAFSGSLAPGDLILIIQHQGALINTTDDSTYGQVVSYGNCGNYELCQVASVPGPSAITLSCGTANSYSASGRTQVIRVPRYVRLTVNSGAAITGPVWNGSTGGVVAIEADTSVLINAGGSIDISGKGFRGGILSENLSNYGVLNYRGATGDFGAEKGESIAGYQTGYDSLGGRFAKGAPANGGGGGSGHNCGGGGGANGGSPAAWNGRGNPDISVPNYVTAWNLESPGFSGNSSSGGGKGGYSFSSINLDALTVGPFNSGWGGDYRRENGGRGGHPLDYSTGRIFFGGGGGGGDQNDGRGGNGAAGGGIVFISSGGDITGTGLISANGNNGLNSVSSFNANDAAGGAGAGGTVVLKAAGSIGVITIDANGGRGGNQNVGFLQNDAYGPGGGGSGGYISISGGGPLCTVNGGGNGVTNSAGLQEFPPNGATRGGAGTVDSTFSVFTFSAADDTICAGSTSTLTATVTGAVPAGTVFGWYTQPFDGSPVATGASYTTPNLSASTTYYFGPCPGHYRIPVHVIVDAVNAFITPPSPAPCAGSPGDFIGNGSAANTPIVDWSWNFGAGSVLVSGQTVTHTFDTAGTYLVVLNATTSFGCQAVAPLTVNILTGPAVSFSATDTAGCAPFTASFTASAPVSGAYSWDFGDGTTDTTLAASHTYLNPGSYTVSFSAASSQCVSRAEIPGYILVNPLPDATITPGAVSGCYPLTVPFNHQQYPSAVYQWDFGDGTTSSSATPTHTFVAAGSFVVRLITVLAGCSDTGTVTVTATAPVNVAFAAGSVCLGDTSHFLYTPSSPPLSASWDFGDGSSAYGINNIAHLYQSAGNFLVTLTVTDSSGCQGSGSGNIQVLNVPVVSFSVQPGSGCDTVAAQFTNQSTGAAAYVWLFGDGASSAQSSPFHLYTTPGNYSATLVATAANGCSATLTQAGAVVVSSSPTPSFAASSTTFCNNTCISFSDLSTGNPTSWQWSFPGGTPSTSVSSSPGQICYPQPGSYPVTLLIASGSCSRSLTLPDLIHVSDCSVAPTASFYCNDSVFCANGCTSFQSTAQNATQWNWQFTGGTPATSTLPNPQFICYPSSGIYPVTLIVTNPAGSDTLYAIGMVTVDNVPPVPVFTRSGDTLITAVVPGYSYQWYIGGVAIPGANSYRYLAQQSANYSVSVTNVSGCRALSQAQYVSLVGIEEAEFLFGIDVYPNPFDDRLLVSVSASGLTSLLLQLFDVTGRLVFEERIDEMIIGHPVPANTSVVSPGTYLVKITAKGGTLVRKMVKL